MVRYLLRLTLLVALVLIGRAALRRAQENSSSADGEAKVVNPYLGLTAFPGSVILEQRGKTHDSKTAFESEAGLEELYEHFHAQLIELGWERTEVENEDDEIEASYRREGQRLELELEAKGDGRYELEIEVED